MASAAQCRSVSEAIRIIVADDHPLYLEGVVHALQSADTIVVVGQATDAAGAVALAQEHMPDLALLDVTMPGGGLRATREITTVCPATKVVMLTASDDEDTLLAALKAGASGYVVKGVSARDLVGVLRSIAAGAVYVAPALAGRILLELTKGRTSNPLDDLTAREHAVLELVATGLSNQEIGQRLDLAEKTIKHYMTNILAKLHVRSRVEAALLAQKAGLGES
jgi:DNA-binding NarL/FixJ family response regulator